MTWALFIANECAMIVSVTRSVLEALHIAARGAYPKECCGLLIGRGTRISAIQETRNIHPTPETHFEVDPVALIAAHRTERAGGAAIAGYYHSHPFGAPEPSATDRASAAGDGKVWAIIGQDELRLWRDDPDDFSSLSYHVIDDVTGRK